jgi:capsular exopolysaccharide synthesis family protein
VRSAGIFIRPAGEKTLMTTLPQTTPLRLPRPAGAGQIAIPSAPAPGALGPVGGGIAPNAGMTGADVWRVFRANLWLIALFVTVGAVAGFFINRYLASHYPKFTASGLVKVQLPEEIFRVNGQEAVSTPQNIELEQKTQATGLVQAKLMLDVLTNSERIRGTQWFKDFFKSGQADPEAAKEDLLRNFAVQPVAQSRLIKVEMTYRVPLDARVVVEEVINEYIEQERKKQADRWTGKASTVRNQYDVYKRDFENVTKELTDRALQTSSRDQFELYALLQSVQSEVHRVVQTVGDAQRELSAAQTELDAFNRLISEGGTPPEIESYLNGDTMLISYQQDLDRLDARGAQTSAPNSPLGASLAKNRETVQRKLDDRRDSLRSSSVDAKRALLQTRKDIAQGAFDTASERKKEVEERQKRTVAAAAAFRTKEESQKVLKGKMDVAQAELDELEKQKLPSSFSPVTWFAEPPTPETPSFPKLVVTMSVAVLLGLGLSVGIAFLREITDTSVRSPRDIARVGQLNLLGLIPHEQDDPQATGARLPLVIYDAPHSMAAEEFRKLRTRLQHAAALDSTRSILVSSANPGDGKTTIACNLAAGLALNGRRILLVDANFRRPEIHNLFEVTNDKGFSDALNDLGAFDTVVRDTPVQNLFVMPTGPKPVNATELLESQLLIDFIERALEDYDHVIFDSGPLLIVSETMALAPRVDGVVTVVRARTNSRGVLSRMRDMLRQVKAEHLGVVLNAVRSQGGGYYARNIKSYYAYQNGNAA